MYSTKVTNPLVSVITPCFNYGHYLSQALDSLSVQTYLNWECIIIDDGSTDNTRQVAELYAAKDRRITYIYQDNAGVSVARNNGISHSKGKYILPLDADDKIDPEYLSKAVAVLESQADIKLIYCEAKFFGDKDEYWKLPDYSFERLLESNMIFCSALFRRSDFNKTAGYNPALRYGWEDWDFWLTFLKDGGKVYRIPEILFFYRIKENSRDRNLNLDGQKFKETYLKIFKNHYAVYEKYGFFVSVIVPVYQDSADLISRIENILEQTWPLYEIIILGKCTTRSNHLHIEEYRQKGRRIKWIPYEQEHANVYKLWNKGVKEAKGKYIWIAEPDSFVNSNFLIELKIQMDYNPLVGIAYCQSQLVDENNNSQGNWVEHPENTDVVAWKANFAMKGMDAVKKYFIKKNIIPSVSAVLFRKTVFEKVGGFNEGMTSGSEWLLWLTMMIYSDVVYVANPMHCLYTHIFGNKRTSEVGKNIEELSQMMVFLASNSRIVQDKMNRILYFVIEEWLHVNSTYNLSKRLNANIYNNLKQADDYVLKRLIKILLFRKTDLLLAFKLSKSIFFKC